MAALVGVGVILSFFSACNALSMFTDRTSELRAGSAVIALVFLVLAVGVFVAAARRPRRQ